MLGSLKLPFGTTPQKRKSVPQVSHIYDVGFPQVSLWHNPKKMPNSGFPQVSLKFPTVSLWHNQKKSNSSCLSSFPHIMLGSLKLPFGTTPQKRKSVPQVSHIYDVGFPQVSLWHNPKKMPNSGFPQVSLKFPTVSLWHNQKKSNSSCLSSFPHIMLGSLKLPFGTTPQKRKSVPQVSHIYDVGFPQVSLWHNPNKKEKLIVRAACCRAPAGSRSPSSAQQLRRRAVAEMATLDRVFCWEPVVSCQGIQPLPPPPFD